MEAIHTLAMCKALLQRFGVGLSNAVAYENPAVQAEVIADLQAISRVLRLLDRAQQAEGLHDALNVLTESDN